MQEIFFISCFKLAVGPGIFSETWGEKLSDDLLSSFFLCIFVLRDLQQRHSQGVVSGLGHCGRGGGKLWEHSDSSETRFLSTGG